jgi:hypothetical protein
MKEALDRSPAKKVDLIAQGYKPTGNNAGGILAELENFPLAYYDTPTSNKQIFTRSLWESLRRSPDIESRMVKTRSFWGMPYHDDDTEVKLPLVSHKVRDFQVDPDSPLKLVSGKVAITDTPNGLIIHSLMQDAFVGISSRGWGSLYDADDGQNQIVSANDYMHVCWDFVGIPAVGPAMATLMNSLKRYGLQEPILEHLLRFPITGFEPIVASLQASMPKHHIVSGDIPVEGGNTDSPAAPEAPAAPEGPVEWWSSSSGRIELQIPLKWADAIHQPGPADGTVAEARRDPFIEAQLDKISDDDLKEELSGYGAWDEEDLADREDNLDRLLWIAACDVDEQKVLNQSKKPVNQAAGGAGGDRNADVVKAETFFGEPSSKGPGVWNWEFGRKGNFTLCMQISEQGGITTYWFNPAYKAPLALRYLQSIDEAPDVIEGMKATNPDKVRWANVPTKAQHMAQVAQAFKSRATLQDFVRALPSDEAKALLEFSQGIGVADPVTLSRACIARLEENRQDVQVRKLMARAGADGSFGNLGDVLETLMTQVEDNLENNQTQAPALPPPENIGASKKPNQTTNPAPAAAKKENTMSANQSTLGGKNTPRRVVSAALAAWTVMLNGKEIDTVFFDKTVGAEAIKESLVKHDGFDPKIEVAPKGPVNTDQSRKPVKSNDETDKTNLPGEPGVPELPDDVGLGAGSDEPEGTPEERAEFDKMVLLELEEQALGEDLDGDGDFPDEEYPSDFEELKQARKVLSAAGEPDDPNAPPAEPEEHTEPEFDEDELGSFDDSDIQVDIDTNTITIETCDDEGDPCNEEYTLEDGYLTLTGDDTGTENPDAPPEEPVDLFTETNGDVQEAVDFIMDLQAGADTVIDMTDEYAEEPAEPEFGTDDDTANK